MKKRITSLVQLSLTTGQALRSSMIRPYPMGNPLFVNRAPIRYFSLKTPQGPRHGVQTPAEDSKSEEAAMAGAKDFLEK
jgi:hypothetical protein